MSAHPEFLSRWLRVAMLSESLLELARCGEWQQLVDQEVSYLQSIENVMRLEMPPDLSPPVRRHLRQLVGNVLDNEQQLKTLLQKRMEELSALIGQSARQQNINNTYGRLSGVLLMPESPR
ncbi:flagella biosynthesis regulatory protein FliT [Entomohabitans teleogrylli]|uniref:flagella biosynthesis regulatory protein FliT n=1 Tax=Entomohabitans teleogrylli TaxID=1384589 RepID=UPI00073D5808|nr:flagella biosynthesis regulatory protein FliT [Entomohabitans teleogrylli]